MKKIYKEKQMYVGLMYMILFGNVYGGIKSLSQKTIDKMIFIPCALAAMVMAMDRNFYLPFLGDAVMPQSLIVSDRSPAGANRVVRLKVAPNTRVIYWAAEPSNRVKKNPWEAYKTYQNAGVTHSDGEGNVLIRIRDPASYKKPYGSALKPHIHYRIMRNNGMMSQIYTKQVPPMAPVHGIG
jgi:hypothetical protein